MTCCAAIDAVQIATLRSNTEQTASDFFVVFDDRFGFPFFTQQVMAVVPAAITRRTSKSVILI